MQKPRPVRKRYSPEEKECFLEAYRQSGLTQRAFAAQSGFSLSCLYTWLSRSKPAPSSPRLSLIELPRVTAGPSAPSQISYQVQFPGGMSLEVPHGFAREEVLRLCQILRAL